MDRLIFHPLIQTSRFPMDLPSEDGDGLATMNVKSQQPVYHRDFALQPLYTSNRGVLGFELFHRDGRVNAFRADPDLVSRIMIDNVLLFGFEEMSAQCLIFINCTRDTLLSGFFPLLPSNVVIEILETVKPDAEVLAACHALKQSGYRISLDDFEDPDTMHPFLDLADFVKIDFRLSNAAERRRLTSALGGRKIIRIAEKIETEQEFQSAVNEDYSLFQGYYLREPTTISKVRLCPNPVRLHHLLELLLHPGTSTEELLEIIQLEPDIECRILRRAHWKAPLGRQISSIRDALQLVGRNELKSVLRLALISMQPMTPA